MCVWGGEEGHSKGMVYGGVVLVLIVFREAWDLLEWCDGCVCLVCVASCGVLTRLRRRRCLCYADISVATRSGLYLRECSTASPSLKPCECADHGGCWCYCFVALRLPGNHTPPTHLSAGREPAHSIQRRACQSLAIRAGAGGSMRLCFVCCFCFWR